MSYLDASTEPAVSWLCCSGASAEQTISLHAVHQLPCRLLISLNDPRQEHNRDACSAENKRCYLQQVLGRGLPSWLDELLGTPGKSSTLASSGAGELVTRLLHCVNCCDNVLIKLLGHVYRNKEVTCLLKLVLQGLCTPCYVVM